MKNEKKWTTAQKISITCAGIGGIGFVLTIYCADTKFMWPLLIVSVLCGMVPLFVALTMTTIELVRQQISVRAYQLAKEKIKRAEEADADEAKLLSELQNLDEVLKKA